MKLSILSEDIRYNQQNREVYKVATTILDEIINKMPEANCHIYSASEEKCEVVIRIGEYYNEILKKKSWKFAIKLRVMLAKQYVYIVGTNIRFQFHPDMPEQVANVVYKYSMIA